MRVLLLDDNTEFRDFLVAALNESGIDATTANSADDAVAQIEKEKFDGIIVNSAIGQTDGVSVAVRARAATSAKSLGVLLMSDINTALAKRIAQNANCKFLAKPFGLAEFMEAVRELR